MVEISNDLIRQAVDFLLKVRGEDEVWVRFQKKDGSMRDMHCTLNFDKIPEREKPKDVDLAKIISLIQKHKMMHAYDLEKRGWRTVPIDRVEYIETPIPDSTERRRFNVRIK